jgi:catechol 2,3-dioxygenase-like lactoylglutathione lyase family enzyme
MANRNFEFTGFNHLALTCSDMQKTTDFYTNVLGMTLVKTMEYTGEGNKGQHFFFDMGNGRDAIAFFWFEEGPPAVSGVAQSGRFYATQKEEATGSIISAAGSMNHVAFGVPPEKLDEYREKLVAMGIDVSEVVNHSNRPGEAGTRGPTDQYTPDEPTEDTFVRSIYFADPDGIVLEFACWGRALTDGDIENKAKTMADRNEEKGLERLRDAVNQVETA